MDIGNNGEFPIDLKDGEFPIDPIDPIEGDKIYEELLHIVQGDHQGDHQEAGQEEEQPWPGNAIWDKLYQEEEQPGLQDESFRNNYAAAEAQRGLLMGQSDHQGVDGNNSAMLALSSSVAQPPPSATQTVPPENFELGSSNVAQPHPSATLTVPPGNFELGSSSVAHPPLSATQTVRPGNFELGGSSVAHPPSSATQTVCPWNFEMGSSIVAQPPPSSTQTVRPENFELGSSSVAQPPPSTTQIVCPVNFELGSSNIAQPPPSTIPIKVLVGGGRAYQQHQYTVHVKPDEEVVVLRKLLKKRKVAYLPQHYLFAFKREVMNEDRSFQDHGIVSVRNTKIEVMDFTVHFPPHHRLREAGIASNRQLAVRR